MINVNAVKLAIKMECIMFYIALIMTYFISINTILHACNFHVFNIAHI